MTRTTISAIALALFGTCIAGGAMAETPWQQNHPGRTEVNHRLANQNARIHQEVNKCVPSQAGGYWPYCVFFVGALYG